ncbi:MAG TPA: hypothetical protein VK660_09245 [Xanthomonadaceae bacterium]|jgi:hypothetical protein|nr:hypothetical protein [Xanthomonadaceae bacterium]
MQRHPDRFQHGFQVLENRIVPESQHVDAGLAQEIAAPCIAGHLVHMLTAVQFYRQASSVVVEIQYVGWEGVLTPELESTKSSTAKKVPDSLLRIRCAMTQLAGEG